MNRHLKAFKTVAAQVAHRHGFSFGVFLGEHGLQDFLIDEVGPTDSPADIAAKAIHYFCIEEGEFNGFFVGLETALQFLNESVRRSGDAAQRHLTFRDLKSILDSGGEIPAIREWIKAHYE